MKKNNENPKYLNFQKGGNEKFFHERADALLNRDERRIISARYNWVITGLNKCKIQEVIDIGCGLGYGTNLIYNAGYNVIGLDYSKEAIQIAKKRYPNIHFISKNLEEYKPEQKFCACVALEVIEHFRLYEKALKKIASFTKQDGHIYISTPRKRGQNPHHIHEFEYKELKKIFPLCKIRGLNHKYASRKPFQWIFGYDVGKTIGLKIDLLPPFIWMPWNYGIYLLKVRPDEIYFHSPD